MDGIVSQEIAILFHRLNIEVHTDNCYFIEKDVLRSLDYSNIKGKHIEQHPPLNFDAISNRIDDETYAKYEPISAFTYAQAIDLIKDRLDIYISIRPYKTHATQRGYAFGADVYDLQPQWKGEKTYTYSVNNDMCMNEGDCIEEVLYELLTSLVVNGRKQYPYILWLDDIRDPESDKWKKIIKNIDGIDVEWCRTRREFSELIRRRGMPYAIYFDHDLGSIEPSESGYACASWLVDYMMDHNINPNIIKVYSQSDNQPGKENILKLIDNYKKFYNNNN